MSARPGESRDREVHA